MKTEKITEPIKKIISSVKARLNLNVREKPLGIFKDLAIFTILSAKYDLISDFSACCRNYTCLKL